MSLRRWLIRFGVGVALLIAVGVVVVLKSQRKVAKNVQRLPDGSTVELKQLMFTSTNFTYTHRSRGPLIETLALVVPDFLLTRFPVGNSGGFGFGTTGATNLFVITQHRRPGRIGIGRLRVIGDSTNVYDACWGASTIGNPAEIVHGWQIRAFPRRSRRLTLELLGKDASGAWMTAGVFEVENPAYGEFPQWQAKPVPITETNGNLAVTLARFRAGAPMEVGKLETEPRKTELQFAFAENGEPTEDWRVQKLTIWDATGNNWFPYLDLVNQRHNWARGGQVEFLGALWPGEQAWKLDVEVVRSGGIPEGDLFTMEIPMPKPALISNFPEEWTHDGVTLKVRGLASPETDHPGSMKWTGKWWGGEKEKVYSLAVELVPGLEGQRLSLARAVDQGGQPVELLEHRGADYSGQAFFLKPSPGATTLRLTFAMTRSRFLYFMARPEFGASGNEQSAGRQ